MGRRLIRLPGAIHVLQVTALDTDSLTSNRYVASVTIENHVTGVTLHAALTRSDAEAIRDFLNEVLS